jgi:hypothetical protein
MHPTILPRLILVPDGLISDEHGGYALHPALQFMSSRLWRASKLWSEATAMTPVEWYAALIGAAAGASGLLAAAMGDAIPGGARQCWLVSPFAGRLGRDSVHIMPEEMFVWDQTDSQWLLGLLQPLLAGDGFTLLSRDGCMLAVTASPWDAKPHGFAQVAGHLLPNRHPEGRDGGRLMRLCAEMQMLLAAQPARHRRDAGLPDVMGVWLWAPSDLPVTPIMRPRVISDDALIRTCSADAAEALPVAIMRATQVEAQIEHGQPRHWLLGGDGHAVLLTRRSMPRLGRKAWQPRGAMAFPDLARRLRRISGAEGKAA